MNTRGDDEMPIRKVKDENYIFENNLLREFARYVLEKYPNITSEFVNWYKAGLKRR